VADGRGAREHRVAAETIEIAFRIHRSVGPGLLESAYEALFLLELRESGLEVRAQAPMPIRYGEHLIELGFRADLLVEGCLLVELKSVEHLAPVHHKQLLTYLRMSGIRLGLLLNFGAALMKDGIFRIANGLPDD
jgi:GxxExxY protein